MNEKWLYGPEKFPGLSRNGPQNLVNFTSGRDDQHPRGAFQLIREFPRGMKHDETAEPITESHSVLTNRKL